MWQTSYDHIRKFSHGLRCGSDAHLRLFHLRPFKSLGNLRYTRFFTRFGATSSKRTYRGCATRYIFNRCTRPVSNTFYIIHSGNELNGTECKNKHPYPG